MEPTDATSTKQRKLAAGQDDAPGQGRSALRALRLGFARAARDVFELPCAVIGATQARIAQDALPEALGEDRMLILIDGPDRAIGVATLDHACLAAIIQQQTMCQVTGGEVAERPFTATDAAMVAPLIDGTIQRAAALSEIVADSDCLTGFRFGAKAEDMRTIVLAVEAKRFRTFDLTIDFDNGKLQGRMTLALPEAPTDTAEEDAAKAESRARMQRAVGGAQADMMAVIGHLRLPLAKLGQMQEGDLLPLVHDKLNQADLVAIDGRKVATVRLGQSGGWRAVRFAAPNRMDADGPSGGQEFKSHALAAPEMPAPAADVQMTDPVDMPAPIDMPTAIDMPAAPPEAAAMGFPAIEEDSEMALPQMSPEDAAAEISELAGLTLGGDDLPGTELDLPAPTMDLPQTPIDLPLPDAS